ncbi:hypothetical protein H4281_13470 [Amycolatopsis sp. DR6-1]|uniref:Acyl-CoA carboxylase epsilon subunit n=1 Tax=Amycolatopsis dendrobii TaxID=2760662 RepID=A0A7W3VWQ4_9PSEU|nr:hypothetical protein [Amycolatopsis dendrobii]
MTAGAGLEVLASVGESGARGEPGGVPDDVRQAAGTHGERCAVTAGYADSARTKPAEASREAAGLESAPAPDERRAAAAADAAERDAVGVRGEQRAAVAAPAVRVVRGNPDDVEVAALLVALAAVGQAAGGGHEEIAVPSPRRPLARFVPATSWRAR